MKNYEFHSKLPPETVFSRLAGWTKPSDMFACWGKGIFYYSRKKDAFWLAYTGDLPVNGSVPFRGEVRPEGDGSVITGDFSVWRSMWKPLLAMGGFMCLVALLFGASLEFMLTIVLPVTAIWVLMCVGFTSWNQKAFFKKRQRATLEFIEQHLLE